MADARILGVLGGMGPLASACFMQRLTLLTPAERDQDHIPTILWSDPRVPDRTAARVAGGEDPLPALVRGIRGLEASLLNWYTHVLLRRAHVVESQFVELALQSSHDSISFFTSCW